MPNFNTISGEAGLNAISRADLATIIGRILPFIFYGAGIALLIYLIMGGFQLMLSRGDPKAIEGGRSKITNAIIGFVIVFISYWIVGILGQVFGLDAFNQIFGGGYRPGR